MKVCHDYDCHKTPQYIYGVNQLKRWHERCRRKRLGLDTPESLLREEIKRWYNRTMNELKS